MAKKKKPTQPADPLGSPTPGVPTPAKPAPRSAPPPAPTSPRSAPPPASAGAPAPSAAQDPQDPDRDASGRFVKGHAKTGGIQRGQKQKLSLAVQNSVLSMVSHEVSSDRFSAGLKDLYHEDPKSYYQVLTGLMKFCAPTLQSQSLEITDKQQARSIDDRLDELMNTINPIKKKDE